MENVQRLNVVLKKERIVASKCLDSASNGTVGRGFRPYVIGGENNRSNRVAAHSNSEIHPGTQVATEQYRRKTEPQTSTEVFSNRQHGLDSARNSD